MELAIWKALTSVNIDPVLADNVVNAMESHFADRISTATAPILGKLDTISAQIASNAKVMEAYAGVKTEKQINHRWIVGTLIGGVALVVSTSTATVGILKALGLI